MSRIVDCPYCTPLLPGYASDCKRKCEVCDNLGKVEMLEDDDPDERTGRYGYKTISKIAGCVPITTG